MAGFITLPQHRNPWMEQLPQFVQQLAFQKIGQKFQEKQTTQQQSFREQEIEEQRGYDKQLTKEQREYVTSERVAGQESRLNLELAKDPGLAKIDGDKTVFLFNKKSGMLYDTGIPTKKSSGVTQNVNVDTMTKRTQGDLEADIVQGQDTLAKLDRVEELFKPEYLEYAGKGKAWLQDIGSKAGLKTGEFLAGYKKWAAEVDAHTLLWRKYITGVAGGPKEMEAIERTTINTKYDSPASFKAKSEQIRIITNAQVKRSKDLLSKGFDLEKMSPEARAAVVQQYPIENYGYKELEIPGGKPRAEYTPGKLYEDAKGDKMRFEGYDNSGKPVWGKQ